MVTYTITRVSLVAPHLRDWYFGRNNGRYR